MPVYPGALRLADNTSTTMPSAGGVSRLLLGLRNLALRTQRRMELNAEAQNTQRKDFRFTNDQ